MKSVLNLGECSGNTDGLAWNILNGYNYKNWLLSVEVVMVGGGGYACNYQDRSRPIQVARPELTFVEKTQRMILDEKIISEIPV